MVKRSGSNSLTNPKRLRTWPWSKPARRLGDYHGGILRNGRIRIYEAALSSKEKALHTVHHEIKHAKDYSGLGYLKDMLKYGVAGMLSSLGTACVEITALNYLNRLDIVQQLYKTGLNPLYLALITVPLVGLAAGKRLADKRFAENEILVDRYADKRMEELGYVRSVDE